jgi:hypothetical protein
MGQCMCSGLPGVWLIALLTAVRPTPIVTGEKLETSSARQNQRSWNLRPASSSH